MQLRFSIVKHVIDVRLEESAAKNNEVADKAHNQAILKLIDDKKKESLAGLSIEELEAKLK